MLGHNYLAAIRDADSKEQDSTGTLIQQQSSSSQEHSDSKFESKQREGIFTHASGTTAVTMSEAKGVKVGYDGDGKVTNITAGYQGSAGVTTVDGQGTTTAGVITKQLSRKESNNDRNVVVRCEFTEQSSAPVPSASQYLATRMSSEQKFADDFGRITSSAMTKAIDDAKREAGDSANLAETVVTKLQEQHEAMFQDMRTLARQNAVASLTNR